MFVKVTLNNEGEIMRGILWVALTVAMLAACGCEDVKTALNIPDKNQTEEENQRRRNRWNPATSMQQTMEDSGMTPEMLAASLQDMAEAQRRREAQMREDATRNEMDRMRHEVQQARDEARQAKNDADMARREADRSRHRAMYGW